jgi:hypothetical protein
MISFADEYMQQSNEIGIIFKIKWQEFFKEWA